MAIVPPRNPPVFIGGALAAIHNLVFFAFAIAQLDARIPAEGALLHAGVERIVAGVSAAAKTLLVIPDIGVIADAAVKHRPEIDLSVA